MSHKIQSNVSPKKLIVIEDHIQWSPYMWPNSPEGTPLIRPSFQRTNYIFVFNIPLTRGHSSNKASFSISQGWLYKRGPLYMHWIALMRYDNVRQTVL